MPDEELKVKKPYPVYNLHMRKLLDIPEKQEIYIYGG
jgi:hypothetical protein